MALSVISHCCSLCNFWVFHPWFIDPLEIFPESGCWDNVDVSSEAGSSVLVLTNVEEFVVICDCTNAKGMFSRDVITASASARSFSTESEG